MSWTLVALAAVAATPWRNGGGVTRELLAWPSAADWRLRLSVAEIAGGGAFSGFTGRERWFAVLEGEGVDLRVEDVRHRLTVASEPLRFDGGAAAHAELVDGPTLDFNLMAAPGTARMLRLAGRSQHAVAPGRLVAAYAHGQGMSLAVGDDTLHLPAATLAWRRVDAATVVHAEARDALWMEVLA